MNRPEIRIIQNQEEKTGPANIDSWEAEQLLRKYGHQSQQFSTREEPQISHPSQNLTFEEMIAQEEAKRISEEERKRQIALGPKPLTFDSRNGYDSETKYGTEEDSGFSFKIEIVFWFRGYTVAIWGFGLVVVGVRL